tara:strand:+ start:249 stop:992 length:744 start_codon:yes stop_codon:yes gene_type:complete
MENALENENLNQGEFNDNVGQDEGKQAEESNSNWEQQAKYFQSEKDKLYAENQNLKKYEKLGHMMESRPDIVNAVSGMLQGGEPANQQEQRISLDKDEFDPWEAYNDPSSKSYQFRQQELQDSINDAVKEKVLPIANDLRKQTGMNQLTSELEKRGLDEKQIESFYKFAQTNPAEFGIDGALNMWQSVTQNPTEGEQNNQNPMDSIRQNQSVPQQAGILNGEQPIKTSEKDDMWKGILKAGSRSNVL